MKRILFLSLFFALAGCQIQASSLGSSPEMAEDLPLETSAPSPVPEDTPTVPSPTSELPNDHPVSDIQIRFESSGILELAARDLAARLDVDLNVIKVLSIQFMEWPDGGLGCPFPGMEYAQVVTPGYRIVLSYEGEVYIYHTNAEGQIVLCQDGLAQLPNFPVDPKEIMDGIPWMPVDPLPTISTGGLITDPVPVK